jgi:hypothetical protein
MSKLVDDFITHSILSYDAMADAEHMMGISKCVTEHQKLVAVSLACHTNFTKQERMIEIGDTAFGDQVARYLHIIEEFGFELALRSEFEHKGYDDVTSNEVQYLYGHREYGIVLNFDTSGGTHVNGGSIHYAWKSPTRDMSEKERNKFSILHKGGGWESPTVPDWRCHFNTGVFPSDLFWFGNQDCREALCFHIRRMAENGTFHKQWPSGRSCRGLMMTHHGDYSEVVKDMHPMSRIGYLEYLTKCRVNKSPDWFQHIINGNC